MTRSNQAAAIVAAAILSFCLAAAGQAAVPDSLNYQGYLTDETGSPINGQRQFRFSIYNVETGGSPLWVVDQNLPVDQGLFTAELGGPHTPFRPPFAPPGLFDQPLWLGVEVGFDGEMLPRRPLTTVGFSFKAEDADALQGHSALELDQSLHVAATGNPHDVTASQAGAVATGDFNTHAANDSAHHLKTTSFNELSGQVPWSVLSGIPADIADGDNDSGGDITGVSAGYGLDGGGAAGSVALALENPLALTGDLLLNTGSVGIGITNPNRKLYVLNDAPGLDYALKLDNPNSPGVGQTGVGILFSTEGGGPTRGKGALAYVSTDTWNRGAFHFLQEPNIGFGNPDIGDAVMTITNRGNVGVGTTSPQAKLDVVGDIRVAGNVEVNGNLTQASRENFYSLAGSDFQPADPRYDYYKSHATLRWQGAPFSSPEYNFFAPVNLPHGATVTKVISYWTDVSSEDFTLGLRGLHHSTSDTFSMAYMETSFNQAGVRLAFDDSIEHSIIDNDNFAYYMIVRFVEGAENDVEFHSVRIEYTTTGS